VNAYLLAAMRSYLQRLESGLRSIGIAAPTLVMTSNGGMLAANVTCEKPVLVVASGPAGGVIGAARLGVALASRAMIAMSSCSIWAARLQRPSLSRMAVPA
jgi:N-methylhydantoinase A